MFITIWWKIYTFILEKELVPLITVNPDRDLIWNKDDSTLKIKIQVNTQSRS